MSVGQGNPGDAPRFRLSSEQVRQWNVRNLSGEMTPLGSVCAVREIGGPALVIRDNGVTAAAVYGGSRPGFSSGVGIRTIDGLATRKLLQGMDYRSTELTLLQVDAGTTAIMVFGGAVPLALAVGADAEMRSTLGIAVFAGILGVTGFGILLTPVFDYVVVRLLGVPKTAKEAPPPDEKKAPATAHEH